MAKKILDFVEDKKDFQLGLIVGRIIQREILPEGRWELTKAKSTEKYNLKLFDDEGDIKKEFEIIKTKDDWEIKRWTNMYNFNRRW